jgi:competence ComEA-like helix-hairpin-helix protein
MPAVWPRASQRVLLAAAALLLALTLFAAQRASRRSLETPLADDPGLAVRIDLNAAAAADLEALPGIGAALAARIVGHREAHGPFRDAGELARVPGVGEKLAERLRPLVACSVPR